MDVIKKYNNYIDLGRNIIKVKTIYKRHSLVEPLFIKATDDKEYRISLEVKQGISELLKTQTDLCFYSEYNNENYRFKLLDVTIAFVKEINDKVILEILCRDIKMTS